MHATLTHGSAVSGRELGYSTLSEEVELASLPLRGSVPDWLAGDLIRLTPALLDHGRVPVTHWFDGLAMLHAFGIRGGRVSYANRFLESRDYHHFREHGQHRGQGFATDPCRSLFKRVATLFSEPELSDNCNVNIARLGERWMAMTETPLAIEFDPETLETIGHVEWQDQFRDHVASAHPHYDPERDELVSYSSRFGPRSSYRVFALPAGSRTRRSIAKLPVREPAYMHSFALTPRYAVLFEQPLVVDPMRLALSSESFIGSYRWKPERGTRFLVVDREGGDQVATVEAEAFFAFHQVNAFEAGNEVVVDIVAYDDPAILEQLETAKLRDPESSNAPTRLRRFRLPLNGGAARCEDLSDEVIELPRIAYRSHSGQPYRYLYAAGHHVPGPAFDQLVKIDVESGSAVRWRQESCHPGEPVFVPAPDPRSEDEGVVLSVVLDAVAGRSFLLVLDAGDMTELARAEAPHHIPFGFHGDFAGKDDQ